MGSVVGGLLGTNGGAGGTGFAGPKETQIDMPATMDQANQAYTDTQNSLAQQQAFLQALQAQNGIQNQTNVFNQMQGVANGTGPNPAQTMLNNATGANVANQAALMAGARGSNANAGLIARQAAQQGAATQQQAAGQAAAMQSQQQLNALGQLGGMAGQQVSQQANATNNAVQSQQSEQSALINSINANNSTRAGLQANINSTNGALAQQTMAGQQQMMGNLMGGVGSVMGMLAEGGTVRKGYDEGGQVNSTDPNAVSTAQTPMHAVIQPESSSSGGGKSGGGAGLLALLADGGQIPNQAGQYVPLDPNAPDVFDPTMTNSGSPVQGQSASAMPTIPTAAPQVTAPTSGPRSNVGMHMSGSPNAKTMSGADMFGNVIGKGIGMGISALYHALGGGSSSSNASGVGSKEDQDSGGLLTAQAHQDENNASGLPLNQDVLTNEQKLAQPGPTEQMPASQDGEPMAAQGGKVPVLLSPGEKVLSPSEAQKAKQGKDPLSMGKTVPGKSPYPGNDYRNDTYKSSEKPGSLVIPNEVMQSKNPNWAAKKFVEQHLAKGGLVQGLHSKRSKKAKK